MKKLATILMIVAMASPIWADYILQYDIAGADGVTAQVADIAANITATELGTEGVTTRRPGGEYDSMVSAMRWPTVSVPDPGKHLEFAVTAGPGYTVSYDSITFALFRDYNSASDYGAESWQLHGSIDAFSASDIFLFSVSIAGSGPDEQVVFSQQDISVLGTQSGTVTFRLYGYDAGRNNSYAGLGNEEGTYLTGTGSDLILEGLVSPPSPAPEPMTILVLALGTVAYFFCPIFVRRRAVQGYRS